MDEKENFDKKEEESPVREISYSDIKIPDCCTEGWKSCPHVVKRPKKEKTNIAL